MNLAWLKTRRGKVTGGLVAALVVGGSVLGFTMAASATAKPSVGLDSAGNWHLCVQVAAPHNVAANTNQANWATNVCPSGYTQIHYNVNTPVTQYGIAEVDISRGGAAATKWGTFSTSLGSPVGDQASGTLRMSCSAAQAPCVISVKAYATADGYSVYPRLDIQSQPFDASGPISNCEYADGSTNDGGVTALAVGAGSSVTVPLAVGGSLDCNPPTQTLPASGVVNSIQVPAGRYDIFSTFIVTKNAS